MRPEIGRDLTAFRNQWRAYAFRSDDAWIKANSEIEPQRLHALGVISFRWNMSEQLLFALFRELLNLPDREARILGHELGDKDLTDRVKVLAETRLKATKACAPDRQCLGSLRPMPAESKSGDPFRRPDCVR